MESTLPCGLLFLGRQCSSLEHKQDSPCFKQQCQSCELARPQMEATEVLVGRQHGKRRGVLRQHERACLIRNLGGISENHSFLGSCQKHLPPSARRPHQHVGAPFLRPLGVQGIACDLLLQALATWKSAKNFLNKMELSDSRSQQHNPRYGAWSHFV